MVVAGGAVAAAAAAEEEVHCTRGDFLVVAAAAAAADAKTDKDRPAAVQQHATVSVPVAVADWIDSSLVV
jgi:hypothetical protein